MERHARETYHTIKVAVVIPLLQAIASGLLLGTLVAALLYLLELNTAILAFSAMIAALVGSVAWVSGLRFWRDMVSSIDGKIERLPLYSQVEPDELPEPGTVRVELVESGGRAGHYIELPCSPGKLKALASGVISGKSFTEASWCGSNGLFSRGEFAKLRDEMLRRGLLMLNSPSTPARGYRLTRGGEAAFRYLAESQAPPLLSDGSDIGNF
jgi:hypothetical protein